MPFTTTPRTWRKKWLLRVRLAAGCSIFHTWPRQAESGMSSWWWPGLLITRCLVTEHCTMENLEQPGGHAFYISKNKQFCGGFWHWHWHCKPVSHLFTLSRNLMKSSRLLEKDSVVHVGSVCQGSCSALCGETRPSLAREGLLLVTQHLIKSRI